MGVSVRERDCGCERDHCVSMCEKDSVCGGGCLGMCMCMCMWLGGMAVDPLPPDPHDIIMSLRRDCLLDFAKIQGPPQNVVCVCMSCSVHVLSVVSGVDGGGVCVCV